MIHRKELFDFMLKQVKRTADKCALQEPQAFGRWFSEMYFRGVTNVKVSDGSGDGKVDLFVTCHAGKTIRYRILNTKFTEKYDQSSPVAFYDEITRYWQAFENKENRASYLSVVREELHAHFKKLFKLYDDGLAELYFVTNHRKNEKQYSSVQNYEVEILHLDDLLHYVAEYMEEAMPETEPLLLSAISNVLSPLPTESAVPTSIVFARLIDFIDYMEDDPLDLLFARNVRVWRGLSGRQETNRAIQSTFRNAPREFAYSNNGITIICDSLNHDHGRQELRLNNPRVVNGSQTLHSIKGVDNPSREARVMVRIIVIPSSGEHGIVNQQKKKEIVRNISIRSNQQNPITCYDLAANDDFQHDLSRYFREKGYYYERRRGEWKRRRLDLSSIGVTKGPDVRRMTQLIAAFYSDRKKLGPAVARGKPSELFEEDTYSIIRKTSPTLAYQLFLLAELNDRAIKRLSQKRKYIRNVKGYINLSAFAWLSKILRQTGVGFGKENLNQVLEEERAEEHKEWDNTIKRILDYILEHFKKAAASELKQEGTQLTPANYFKNTTLISELMARSIPSNLRKIAARLQ